MCDLLVLAKKAYRSFCILKKEDDEALISVCCYLLQQAVEKCLKCAVELKGGKQPWGHDIDELYQKYIESGWESIPELAELADTLTIWEDKSRYNVNFGADINKMQKAVDVYLRLEEVIVLELQQLGKSVEVSAPYKVQGAPLTALGVLDSVQE